MKQLYRTHNRVAAVALAALLGACAGVHVPLLPSFSRPPEVAREWVDLHKTTESDTSLWVLRRDGYDGSAHLRVTSDAFGKARVVRSESRYGAWYLKGTLGDSAHQAICFSKRLGRFGPTCDGFSLDTIPGPSGPIPRLTLFGYKGDHSTTTRVLVARDTAQMSR
ncbi:MAG: hypothetical protein ABI442_20625 [Gemmatimonadaceae bacterium]